MLDENIDLADHDVYLRGSDLACRLRAEGFDGVVCILTGAHRKRVEELSILPHVDLAFEKTGDLKLIASELLRVHLERVQRAMER